MNINFKTPEDRDVAIDTGLYPANAGNVSVVDGLITATEIGKCIAQANNNPSLKEMMYDSRQAAIALSDASAASPSTPSSIVLATEPLRHMLAQVYATSKWLPGLEQEESIAVLQLRKNLELSVRLAIAHYCNRDKLRELLDADCARISALVIDENKDPELSLIRKEAIIDFVLLRHAKKFDYVQSPVSFTLSPNADLVIRLIERMVLLQNVGFIRSEEELQAAAKNKQADIAALTDRAIAQLISLDPTI